MYDLFRVYFAGAIGTMLFWLGVGAMTPEAEPTITDAPYRALTALNVDWMGVAEPDPGQWKRYQDVIGEAPAYWRSLEARMGGKDARPKDWPEGFDWPYDVDRTFAPTAPAIVKDAGVRAIEECRAAGLFERLAEARRTLRPVRVYDDVETPVLDTLHHELGYSRSTARLLAMRMALAAERGDEADFVAALKDAHWVGHTAGQSMLIGALVDVAIHWLVTHEVRFALATHKFSDATLVEIDAILAGWTLRPATRAGFLGERQMQADVMQRMFSDDGKGSGWFVWSPYSMELLDFDSAPPMDLLMKAGPWMGLTMASRSAHDEAFDAILADAMRGLKAEHSREAGSIGDRVLDSYNRYRFTVFHILIPALGKAVQTTFQVESHIAGTRILIALERHRLKHGREAATLDALVPEFLSDIPKDTISGEAWVYTRFPTPDSHGRTILLYSIGGDGEDNGGVHETVAGTASTRGHGFDYVINTPRE
jgi:hypothetical protein